MVNLLHFGEELSQETLAALQSFLQDTYSGWSGRSGEVSEYVRAGWCRWRDLLGVLIDNLDPELLTSTQLALEGTLEAWLRANGALGEDACTLAFGSQFRKGVGKLRVKEGGGSADLHTNKRVWRRLVGGKGRGGAAFRARVSPRVKFQLTQACGNMATDHAVWFSASLHGFRRPVSLGF